MAEIKDRLNELKLQLAGMKERLNVEFRINLDDIIDQPRTGEIPVEELQEKADRMKKRLENLGEVNPTAIEAFQEMKKRYEFILEQKNDLVSAKDSLLQTIQEVEATANQQFLDTFNKVRENFQKVFKALFTEEDTADMILENPGEPGRDRDRYCGQTKRQTTFFDHPVERGRKDIDGNGAVVCHLPDQAGAILYPG